MTVWLSRAEKHGEFEHYLVNRDSSKLSKIISGIINSPGMGYVAIDKECKIFDLNQAYLDALGKDRCDVIGRPILEVTPESKLPWILETGETDRVDIWSINGRNMLASRLPIKENDKVIGAIGHTLVLDIPVNEFLVNTMQNSESKVIFEGLIERYDEAYVIVDKAGYIAAINDTLLDLLNINNRSEAIGKHIMQVVPHSKLMETITTGRVDSVDIWPVAKNHDIIVKRLPLKQDGQIIGAIAHSVLLDMPMAKMLLQKLQHTDKVLSIYKDVRTMYSAHWTFDNLVGNTSEYMTIKAMAQQFSQTSSTLLITGESGTGKEMFAQAIHNAGDRRKGPFIRVNCSALPENLVESELFGYEDGAFTGAKKGGKPGKFELAQGGTIFLDEIGDMPLTMQTRLLSVLQERVVERVGGTIPLRINARVIAATNRDLEEMVVNHEFRGDLYYRINVVQLKLLPLRKHMEDLPILVTDLMNRLNAKLETNINSISNTAIDLLMKYEWPGNVRELENLLERAINLAHMNLRTCLDHNDFPSLLEDGPVIIEVNDNPRNLSEAIENVEKAMLVQALIKSGNNRTKAAKLLGIHSSALYRKLAKYGIC